MEGGSEIGGGERRDGVEEGGGVECGLYAESWGACRLGFQKGLERRADRSGQRIGEGRSRRVWAQQSGALRVAREGVRARVRVWRKRRYVADRLL